jgi:hypothetical protein
MPDGLVISRGTVAHRAVDAVADVLEATERRAFRVEVCLTSLSRSERDVLSISATPSASVAASLAGVVPSAAVQAVVDAASSRSRSKQALVPAISVVEGVIGHIERGQNIPIPVKATTAAGAVETLRYQLVRAGVSCGVKVRQLAPGVATLHLQLSVNETDPSISQIGATRGDTIETDVEIGTGRWAFVGSLARGSQSWERSSWLRLAVGGSNDAEDLDCLVRITE